MKTLTTFLAALAALPLAVSGDPGYDGLIESAQRLEIVPSAPREAAWWRRLAAHRETQARACEAGNLPLAQIALSGKKQGRREQATSCTRPTLTAWVAKPCDEVLLHIRSAESTYLTSRCSQRSDELQQPFPLLWSSRNGAQRRLSPQE